MSVKRFRKRLDKMVAAVARCEAYEAKPLETRLAELLHDREKLDFHIKGQQLKMDKLNAAISDIQNQMLMEIVGDASGTI